MAAFVGVVGGVRGSVRRQTICASTAKPLKVSTDMKGKAVWTLREAKAADVAAISRMEDALPLPADLIQSIIEAGQGSSLVAQVTLKGGETSSAAALAKAGDADVESSESNEKIVGLVLANITKSLANPEAGAQSQVKSVGDVIAIKVDPRMPESDDVQKKLLLGSLKKLKGANVNDTFVTIPKGAAALEELFVSSGFEMSSEEEGETTMYANLVGLSPDPQKKIM